MELISITPRNFWDKMYNTKYVMLLAHLAKYNDYVELAKSHPECYKICDNSIIECGETFSIENEFLAAKKLGAQELILPDGYPSGKKTQKLVLESLDWIKKNNELGRFKLMAVVHGQNMEEWLETFKLFNSIKEIDVLGIPKVLCKWLPSKSRMELAHIFTNTDKEIHLLGSWFSLKEIVDIPSELWSRIRSCDTCLPSYYAINHKPILEDRNGTIDLEKEYPELNDESYNRVMAEYNYYIREK